MSLRPVCSTELVPGQPELYTEKHYFSKKKEKKNARWWQFTPLIPALGGRGRQIPEFEARLVYRVSSRTARTITQTACISKEQNKTEPKK